jgi:hypothetical protein
MRARNSNRGLVGSRRLRAAALVAALVAGSALRAAAGGGGTVSGSVTIDGEPAAGVWVGVSCQGCPDRMSVAVATGEDGRFRAEGLAPGEYDVSAEKAGFYYEGKPSASTVRVGEGDSVEGPAIGLRRGGAVTGRVIDPDGRPFVGVRINLRPLDADAAAAPYRAASRGAITDDRGVYRAYGLPAGRYVVTVRIDTAMRDGRFAPATFHPSAHLRADARPVEVAAGAETTGVDIVVAPPDDAVYTVSGRVARADDEPLPWARLAIVAESRVGRGWERASGEIVANERGVFRVEGLASGTYALLLADLGLRGSEYADPVRFVVAGRDVEALVVPVRAGATIRGRVVVEGPAPRDLAERLSRFRIRAQTSDENHDGDFHGLYGRESPVSPDGSFLLVGVKPGRVSISVEPSHRAQTHTWLRLAGASPVPDSPGAIAVDGNMSDLRVVIAFGTGAIRGRVELADGRGPAAGARILVEHTETRSLRATFADADGAFRIDHLVTGEYVVEVGTSAPRAQGMSRVTVGNDSVVETSITLELAKPAGPGEERR